MRGLLLLGIIALGVALGAPVASAQTIFIDTNGDGMHTAADVLNPAGTTTLHVWLATDENGDGTEASCGVSSSPLTLTSWSMLLRITGGTVSWARFASVLPGYTIGSACDYETPDTFARFRGAAGPGLPPGRYEVATVDVTITGGTPSLSFLPVDETGCGSTSFGSACEGEAFNNTVSLGADWFDAYGVATAGAVDREPPSPIRNASPEDGATSVGWASWLYAAGAADVTPPVEYQFELFATDDCSLTPIATSPWSASLHWEPPAGTLRESTTYSWHLRARDSVMPAPNVSGWSTCTLFTTDPDVEAPTGVANLSPDLWSWVSTHPTLVARTATDATAPVEYEFELYGRDDTAGPCAGPLLGTRPFAPSTSWSPAVLLALDTVYFWRHRARDGAMVPNVSRFSECWAMRTVLSEEDAGPMEPDAGPMGMDGGPMESDAGSMEIDAGPMELDAGPMEIDGGTPGTDAGVPGVDGGPVATDAGPAETDAGAMETDAGPMGPDPDAGEREDASMPAPDGGGMTGGDAASEPPPMGDEGCSCRAAGASRAPGLPAVGLAISFALVLAARTRRRRR